MKQKCKMCGKHEFLAQEEICDSCLKEEMKFWSMMKK